MKIMLCFILFSMLNVSGSIFSQSATFNLDVNGKTVKEVFKDIERQSPYRFLYNDDFTGLNRVVSFNSSKDNNINEVLNELLVGADLTYRQLENDLIVITPLEITSQQRIVSGTVTSAEDGSPIPGVTVIVKGTTTGSTTNYNGNYSITVSDEMDVLVFSFVGMITKEVILEGRTSINVVLEPDVIGIEEVVAIGYGVRSKVSLTGNISMADLDVVKSNPVSNISSGLLSAVPGINVYTDHRPGQDAQIRIHGLGTINNNDPLWVIDGVPGGSIARISPNDIESISVLKDAASAAIYGARGANGVILVTTKQGRKNQVLQVEFSARVGTNNNVARYDLLNTQEHGEMIWLEARNSGVQPNHPYYGSGEQPAFPRYLLPAGANEANLDLYNQYTYAITEANLEGIDWHDEILSPGLVQDYTISISGGSENTSYALNVSTLDEAGVVKLSGFERQTLSAAINSDLTNWFTVGSNVMIASANRWGFDGAGENGAMGSIPQLLPHMPIYDVMGNYAPLSRLNGFDPLNNVVANIERDEHFTRKNLVVRGSLNAEFKLSENLSFRSLLGILDDQYNSHRPLAANPEDYQARSDNQLTMSSNKNFQWNFTNTLNYSTTLSNIHEINILLGSEAVNRTYRSMTAMRTGYLLNELNYYVLDAGEGSQTNSGSGYEWALFSLFGRLNYGFDNKYLLDFTLRRDGSSRFGAENRYGLFPSVGLGWLITGENFMSGTRNWLDLLKIRASYGQSGNDQIGNYNGFSTLTSHMRRSFYPIQGGGIPIVGYYQTAIGNPDARWETTIARNLGIDASFFGRLNMTLDIWQRETKDMLFRVAVPEVYGSATPPNVNIGDMKNQGIDLQLNYRGSGFNNELTYNLLFNISHYTNEITKLSDAEDEFLQGSEIRGSRYTRAEVGRAFPEFYGLIVDGIFQNEAEAANHPPAFGAYNKPGRFIFRDVNGDGVVDFDDRTYMGSPHPDFVTSLTGNLQYKQFDFAATFFASVGNDIVNVKLRFLDFNMFMRNRSTKRLYESWGSPYLADNKDAKMPMAELVDGISQEPSTYFVEDGSYLRLQNLQIGYTLPNRILPRGIGNVRIYFAASNLVTITGYSGLDPMVQTSDINSGIDHGHWPAPRRLLFGINLNL